MCGADQDKQFAKSLAKRTEKQQSTNQIPSSATEEKWYYYEAGHDMKFSLKNNEMVFFYI